MSRHAGVGDGERRRIYRQRRRLGLTVRQGTKTPCRRNGVFGAVPAFPSAPPSLTSTWPSCHTARLPSVTEPGSTASKLDSSEQVAPTAGSAVAEHSGTISNEKSLTVA